MPAGECFPAEPRWRGRAFRAGGGYCGVGEDRTRQKGRLRGENQKLGPTLAGADPNPFCPREKETLPRMALFLLFILFH